MKPIRAISLYQPWATFIALGVKPYETRSWPTTYRGPLAIHAGKNKASLPLLEEIPEFRAALRDAKPRPLLAFELPIGAFVCTCNLVDCVPAASVTPDAFGDYSKGRYAWVLKDILVLPQPIPAKGQQGFWDAGTIDDDGANFQLNPNPAPTYYGKVDASTPLKEQSLFDERP